MKRVKTVKESKTTMRASMREAYERDEANARRLEKKLKGRKGPDDGLDSLFEGLPGMDFLEEEYGEDDEEAEGSEDDEERRGR